MEKVKLPREVAEALEKAEESYAWGKYPELIAWCIPDREWALENGEPWVTLHEYGDEKGNFFKLIDALRYGYEVEPEPITVTITLEQQQKVKKIYDHNVFRENWHTTQVIKDVLDASGIKIPGVNT